jgi:hypothetical protein
MGTTQQGMAGCGDAAFHLTWERPGWNNNFLVAVGVAGEVCQAKGWEYMLFS